MGNNLPIAAQKSIQRTIEDVAADIKFTDILQCIAEWSNAMRLIQFVADDYEIYEMSKRYFQAAKIGLKQFEDLRKDKVAVATKTVDLINGMFREPRRELEKIKKHFSTLVGTYEQEEAKKRLAQEIKDKEEACFKVEEEYVPVLSDTTTDEGDKIRIREQLEIVILNPESLLRAILSTQAKNKEFTLDLIDFKIPALKKIAKEVKKIPGCSIKKIVQAQ